MPVDKKRFGILEVMAITVSALPAGMIALPFLQNADQFRPQIESEISAALGREAELGNRQLPIFSGSIVAEEISIADNPASSHSPFVSAKSLQAGIELKPLIFSKSGHISGIALDHPSITAVKPKPGEWNYSDWGGGGSVPIPASSQSGSLSPMEASTRKLKTVEGEAGRVQPREPRSRQSALHHGIALQPDGIIAAAGHPESPGHADDAHEH